MTVRRTSTSKAPQQALATLLIETAVLAKGRRGRVSNVFYAALLQSIFRRNHALFMDKAKGKADAYGDRWPPNSPATIRAKQRRQQGSAQRLNARRDALAVGLASTGLSPAIVRSLAARYAYASVEANETLRNIDTHEMEKSLQPGSRYKGRYYARQNQIAQAMNGRVRFGTTVKHAKHANKSRPIFPRGTNQTRLVRDATQDALEATVREMAEVVR